MRGCGSARKFARCWSAKCLEVIVWHLSSGGRCRVLVAGDAAADADPWGGGDLGYLKDEVPGEIFPKQCEA